jgi:hypothetical protein
MSGRHPPGYNKAYYERHRERIIRQVAEGKRRRREANRARLLALGLLPLPPAYQQHLLDQAAITRFINRLHNLEDLPPKNEDR